MCGPRGVKSCKKFVTLKIKRIKDPGFTLWKRTGPPSCECNDPKDCKNPPEDPYCAPGEPAGTGDCIPFRWPLRFGGLGPIPINPGEPVLGGGPAPEPVGGPIFGQPPIWPTERAVGVAGFMGRLCDHKRNSLAKQFLREMYMDSMRFEGRELGLPAEPVEAGELKDGRVYYCVSFVDKAMLIPRLHPFVFVGRKSRYWR